MRVFKKFFLLVSACTLLNLFSCLPPPKPPKTKQPEIRVGLLIDRAEVSIHLSGHFTLRDPNGRIIARNNSGGDWIVSIEKGQAKSQLLMSEVKAQKQYRLKSGFEIRSEQVSFDHLANRAERISYQGRIKFFKTTDAKITVVNILPLEDYLSGVVPAEMNSSFPLEALKAQAIAARSKAMLGLRQRNSAAFYDICADVGCQVYLGLSRKSEVTDRAVKETHGIVLTSNGELVEAPYSSVCGGHTENNEAVWAGLPQPHLRGRFDLRGDFSRSNSPLRDESNIRKWLETAPEANCNLNGAATSTGLSYARKYFRWHVSHSASELERIIKEKTDQDFGELIDLQPLARGASGRITQIRIVGTKKTFEISGELAIRRALSPETLWSSLFVVDKHIDATTTTFTLRGAGWGHGVGMCQIGAAAMAVRGVSCQRILSYYYKGVKLVRAY